MLPQQLAQTFDFPPGQLHFIFALVQVPRELAYGIAEALQRLQLLVVLGLEGLLVLITALRGVLQGNQL